MLWIEARVLYMPDTCSVTDRIVIGRKRGAGERQCEGACGLLPPLITAFEWLEPPGQEELFTVLEYPSGFSTPR